MVGITAGDIVSGFKDIKPNTDYSHKHTFGVGTFFFQNKKLKKNQLTVQNGYQIKDMKEWGWGGRGQGKVIYKQDIQ